MNNLNGVSVTQCMASQAGNYLVSPLPELSRTGTCALCGFNRMNEEDPEHDIANSHDSSPIIK